MQENNELIPDKVIKKSTFVMEGKNLFKIVYKLLFNNIIHSSTSYSLKHEIKKVSFISLIQVLISL